jgi:hypothetical protein
MASNPVEDYVRELRDIRRSGSGVPETSYYPALKALLDSAGATLKPKVRCIVHVSHGAGFPDIGLFTPDQAFDLLGARTIDVYLNNVAYWKNIPARLWEYTIGGYQVIKKWLSYRERGILGRGLTPDEARMVTDIARRIAAILLMGPRLDANYEAIKGAAYPWPSSTAAGSTSAGINHATDGK